jgi:hypothetical protein
MGSVFILETRKSILLKIDLGLSGKIRAGKTSIKDIQLHPT